MFKKTIEYVDFNGNDRKEDFYFHLSLPEVTRIEAEIGTSLEAHSKKLAAENDHKGLINFLEKVILTSYGVKSEDGKSFRKTKEAREDFEYSQAYAELFEQIITNPELAQQFGSGVAETGKRKTV